MWNHLFSLGGFASQIYVARSDVSRKALKMSHVKKGNIFLPYFWNFFFANCDPPICLAVLPGPDFVR